MIDKQESPSLRYRRANDRSDELGQVFTPVAIAKLLVSELPSSCNRILDLGAGMGALTQAAQDRMNLDQVMMIECDQKCVQWLKKHAGENANVVQASALDTSWEAKWVLGAENSGIISNPPYGMLALSEAQRLKIKSSVLSPPIHGKWVRGDAAFLARAWELADSGVALAFIVTAPIASGQEYSHLRERLVKGLRNLTITQLDERTFPGAEVRAFLVNGVRGVSRPRKVLLRKADMTGQIIDEMSISHGDALKRLDIDYYRACERLRLAHDSPLTTLGDVGTSIVRGSLSRNEFEKRGIGAFHTTDFALNGEHIELSHAASRFHSASAGDILIPRVGSRCLTRHARVVVGEGPFTDCVYRLRSSSIAQDRIWKTIASNFGCEWREAHASGNCARHLTQATLLSMPLL